jgi:hypothetical protein
MSAGHDTSDASALLQSVLLSLFVNAFSAVRTQSLLRLVFREQFLTVNSFAAQFGAALFLVRASSTPFLVPPPPLVNCELPNILCTWPVSVWLRGIYLERQLSLRPQFCNSQRTVCRYYKSHSHKCSFCICGYPRALPDFQPVTHS